MPATSEPSALSPQERASAGVTQLFVGLTPDRVLSAVEAAGLVPTGLCYPLNSFENRVYEIELTAADHPRLIAKFYRPGRWSREQILEEHRFLAELAAEEIPVCPPRSFPDGGTLREIDGILYALWDRQGGRAPHELDADGAARLGRLAARIHIVGSRSDAGPRARLDAERYVRAPLAWMMEHGMIPAAYRDRYAAAAAEIADLYDTGAEGVPHLRIHADLHLGNLLLRDDRLWLVDFDDFAMGPAVQDLWLAVPGRDEHSLALRETLFGAYRELRDLDRATLSLIEPLRGLRMVRYAAWLARRWYDPAFKAAWPHFGSDDYWRDETADLEDQLRAIRGEQASPRSYVVGAPGEEIDAADPSEMTNKDYFWDWEG